MIPDLAHGPKASQTIIPGKRKFCYIDKTLTGKLMQT